MAPGVKVNLTSRGVSSVSLGGKGVTLNAGDKKGTKLTTGIPGTGLSEAHQLSKANERGLSKLPGHPSGFGFGKLLIFVFLGLIVYLVFFG